MTTYTLYAGLIDRANNPVKPHIRTVALQDTVQTFGGYTALLTQGGYSDVRGLPREEPSLRIEVLTDASYTTVRAWAERVRALFNQENVLLTATRNHSAEFIGQTITVSSTLETGANANVQ